MAKFGRAKSATAQIAEGTYGGGDTTNSTIDEEAPLGGSNIGVSGDAGAIRIHTQLWRIQKGCREAGGSEGEEEAKAAQEQAISTRGISRREGAGRRKVRTKRMCVGGWKP